MHIMYKCNYEFIIILFILSLALSGDNCSKHITIVPSTELLLEQIRSDMIRIQSERKGRGGANTRKWLV